MVRGSRRLLGLSSCRRARITTSGALTSASSRSWPFPARADGYDLGGGLGLAVEVGGPLRHHRPTPFEHVASVIGPADRAADPVRQAGLGDLERDVVGDIRAPRPETGAGAVAVPFGPEVGRRHVGRSEPDDHVAAALAFSQTDLIAGSSLSWGALAAGAFRQSSWKTCEGNSCAFPFAGSAPPRVGPGVENQAR
jgi:hypothetical protein